MRLHVPYSKYIPMLITFFLKNVLWLLKLLLKMQVLASKTKIYMVLEYVNGGELFDKIVSTVLHITLQCSSSLKPVLVHLL